MPSTTYAEFVEHLKEIAVIGQIGGLLGWDQETYMPTKAAEQRSQQVSLIAGLAHERFTSDRTGQLLEKLEREADPDVAVVTNVREIRRSYDREVKLPTALVKEIARTRSQALDAWQKARAASDFAQFAPVLDRLLDLKRQAADLIGWTTERYDALMDEFEPGARAADVQAVFDQLKGALVPLVAALKNAPRQPDTTILQRECPRAGQEALNRRVVAAMGFDLEAGRIDVSAHPFCSGTTPFDVRLTTRYDEHYFPMSLFGTMHEAGHGLYEQGLDPTYLGTPMCSSVSLGIHESQSRLWENLVGRSRPFWEHAFPEFQRTFPSMADVPPDAFFFAINTVRPSFIRVEADEVTYGLHIMLRFEIERQMVAGKLATRDVPEQWNALFREFLGLTPSKDAEGCLQDIHWGMGIYGYFPTYQLGNLYASQFFAAAQKALPDLDGQLRKGQLKPLRDWLRENIHRHGMRYRANELVQVVTGAPLSPEPYMAYLNGKFKPLYGLK